MMSQPLIAPIRHPNISAHRSRPSFASVARDIYIHDGLKGFFRGLGPTFLRAFPVNASAIFVYEGILRIMGAEKVRVLTFTSVFILIFLSDQTLIDDLNPHRPIDFNCAPTSVPNIHPDVLLYRFVIAWPSTSLPHTFLIRSK
jgi:hypothetical protein